MYVINTPDDEFGSTRFGILVDANNDGSGDVQRADTTDSKTLVATLPAGTIHIGSNNTMRMKYTGGNLSFYLNGTQTGSSINPGVTYNAGWKLFFLPTSGSVDELTVTDLATPAPLNEGQTYSGSGSFTDPDTTATSWTATVNYDDGSGTNPLTLNTNKTFSLSHVYKDNGSYHITVTVTNNNSVAGTQTATIGVNNVAPTVGTITVTPSPAHFNSAATATASFTDPGVLDTHTATWDWGDGTTSSGTVTESNGSGSVSDTHTYTSVGPYSVTLTVTDKDNASGTNSASITVVKQITSLDPATVWISKNLGNVIKLDLKAEVYKDSTLVSSGELDSVTVGNGGNPTSHTIAFNAFSPVDFPSGSQLTAKVYARNACSGSLLNSGTANLYYNSSAHDSRFGATIGTAATTYHLLDSFLLGTAAGTTDKSVSVAAGAKCSPFKSFGTWTVTP